MAVRSVKKALGILSLFSTSKPSLGIAEISKQLALPKTTVHGLVKTLCEDGFLSRDPGTRKYSIGLKVVELGTILAGSLKINQVGAELAQRLSINTQHGSRLATWDSDSMLITLNTFPSVEYIQYQPVGPRVPAYCTALGKAVLSTFPDSELDAYFERTPIHRYTPNGVTDKQQLLDHIYKARENGYATEKSELLMGVSCIAVPIFDQIGTAIAAISLSGTPDTLMGEKQNDYVTQLVQTGIEISRRMGYRPEAIHT